MHSFRIVSFRFGVFLAVLPAHLFACLIELNELVEIHLCKKQKRQRETASCHQNQTNYAWMCMHPFYQDRHTHFLTAHTSNQFCTFDLNLYLVAHHKNAIKLLVQSSNRSQRQMPLIWKFMHTARWWHAFAVDSFKNGIFAQIPLVRISTKLV